MKSCTIITYGAVAQFDISKQCKILSWFFVLPGLSSNRCQRKQMICHLPLRKRLGLRGGSFSDPFELLGHAESIRQDPAPSCGELRSKNLQRKRSTGRWVQHPQGEIWFCALVFSVVTVLLILVLALGFKLFLNRTASSLLTYWQVLGSPCLCIKRGSSPGMKVGLVSTAGLVSNSPVSWQEITLL